MPSDIAPSEAQAHATASQDWSARDARRSAIAAAVTRELIPAMQAWRTREARRATPRRAKITDVQVQRFAATVVSGTSDAALERLLSLRNDGLDAETLIRDLVAASARELGRAWEQDQCSFFDVTMGLCTLEAVLRRFEAELPPTPPARATVLIAAIPGETHVFGSAVLAALLRRRNWAARVENFAKDRKDLAKAARAIAPDAVVLTISAEANLPRLAPTIKALRQTPGPEILLAGTLITARPDLAARHGADGHVPGFDPQALSMFDRIADRTPVHAGQGS